MMDLAIKLDGVRKKYRFFSLDNICLELPPGQIMGLIGPNGAGKSTTIRILMGLVHQDGGDVRVLGHRMPQEQVAAKWDIGFASDDMRLYEAMTLEWHMNLIRSIYPKWDAAYAQLLLKRFGLRAEQRIKEFSHGQRVKATLLLVLARRPRLLILDEPTTGLDPVARHEILRELTWLTKAAAFCFRRTTRRTSSRSRIRSPLSIAAGSLTRWIKRYTWTGGGAFVWKCRPESSCPRCPGSSMSANRAAWRLRLPMFSRRILPMHMRAPALEFSRLRR